MAIEWKDGLFSCCNDCGICLVTCFCPCYQYGINAQKLDGQSCCTQCLTYILCTAVVPCCCFIHGPRRRLLRGKYGLREECSDTLVTCCCGPCAICK
jgi:Cys-rich protein (TIGR01571 family)